MSKTTWIDVEVVHTTGQAILVSSGGSPVWIPRSAIIDSSDDILIGAEIEIEISEWLATEKGLL
jgi:hypothetical protein